MRKFLRRVAAFFRSQPGGWEFRGSERQIPALRDRECWLPKEMVEKLNAQIQSQGKPTITITINAADPDSVRRFLLDHDSEIAKALRDAHRPPPEHN